MKNISDKAVLVIQVAGFVVALAVLPFVHGWMQTVFAVGFTTHFVGDLLRLTKDGVIKWPF